MAYSHLSLADRAVVHHLSVAGFSDREIGRRLGRHHGTIARERRRNGPAYPVRAPHWHVMAHRRRAGRHRSVRWVRMRLEQRWSPEQIANRLVKDFPADPVMRISRETIYPWAYQDRCRGGRLYRCLRRARPQRRRQARYGGGRGRIPGRVGIGQRPDIVARRGRFGDWEADTVEGAKGSGGIASHVERSSRDLVTAKLTDGKAVSLANRTIGACRNVPRSWRRTLTADNGKELAAFKANERKTGLSVYVANPHAALQRGTCENTNGLLRQSFPKGTDFRQITSDQLADATKNLDHRPRKCLGYQTPHEVFTGHRRGALAT